MTGGNIFCKAVGFHNGRTEYFIGKKKYIRFANGAIGMRIFAVQVIFTAFLFRAVMRKKVMHFTHRNGEHHSRSQRTGKNNPEEASDFH